MRSILSGIVLLFQADRYRIRLVEVTAGNDKSSSSRREVLLVFGSKSAWAKKPWSDLPSHVFTGRYYINTPIGQMVKNLDRYFAGNWRFSQSIEHRRIVGIRSLRHPPGRRGSQKCRAALPDPD